MQFYTLNKNIQYEISILLKRILVKSYSTYNNIAYEFNQHLISTHICRGAFT